MSQIIDISPVAVTDNPLINQSVNGRMLSIACSPDGKILFAGSYSNLWVSYDSGQTWDQLAWPQPDPAEFDVPGALGGVVRRGYRGRTGMAGREAPEVSCQADK